MGIGHSSSSRALICKGLVKVWILLHGGSIGSIHSLDYFPFQPVVKGCGMCCPVCGKVHIKNPLLLIVKSSLCGDIGLPLKKSVPMTICLTSNNRWYENQCAQEASLKKTNFLSSHKWLTLEIDSWSGKMHNCCWCLCWNSYVLDFSSDSFFNWHSLPLMQ